MKRGFTFIETLVIIAIVTLISVAIVNSILLFYRANTSALEQAQAVNEARRGIELLVRDIREASYSDEGAFPIVSMETNQFYFYSDVDRDDKIERMRYFLDGSILRKGVTETAGDPPVYNDVDEVVTIVSTDVRNAEQSTPIFTYYDTTGTEITDLNDVTALRFVTVNLIVNINPERLPNEFTLRSSAAIRNLKDDI